MSGRTFRTPAGAIWPWRGISSFRLFELWLTDRPRVDRWLAFVRAIDPAFEWVLRVFSCYRWEAPGKGLGVLVPSEHPDFYGQIQPFTRYLGDRGFRSELVLLADTNRVFGDPGAARQHAQRIITLTTGEVNLFEEWINEGPKNADPWDDTATWPADMLISRGSNLGDAPPLTPVLRYVPDHSPRDAEWPRKAKNGYEWSEQTGVPCAEDEPMKIGSGSLVASDHFTYHAVAALLCAGSTLHGEHTWVDDPPPVDGPAMACYRAGARAMAMIPPTVQTWRYTRGGLSDCPIAHADSTALRTFARISPDGKESWIVVVRPIDQWQPQAVNGWRIEAQPDRTVLHLTKG